MPTPLTPIIFRGHTVYIKRDDTLSFARISGSKLRKLHSLLTDPTLRHCDCVVSYGGAQSNAMAALAHLCQHVGKPFAYVTRPVPRHLATSQGNFRDALNANMHHVQLDHDTFRTHFTDVPPHSVHEDITRVLQEADLPFARARPYVVPQGGAWPGAEPGIAQLAHELQNQIAHLHQQGLLRNRLPILFLPCGTGTTAFYLQKHLVDVARVVAVPVSGSERYLVKQMRWLDSTDKPQVDAMCTSTFPDVLRPRLRASFADVRPEKLLIWEELRRSAEEAFDFDLIYAPKAWEEVFLAVQEGRVAQNGETLLYYHTGGVEGNVSMLGKLRLLEIAMRHIFV